MKIQIKPLFSELNSGVGRCPLGCKDSCIVHRKAPEFKPPQNQTCPLSSHQAQTYQQICDSNAEVIFNHAATGDGKSLGVYLPGLINARFRTLALYPTNALVKDQKRQLKGYHRLFNLDADKRVDELYGAELARRVEKIKQEGRRGNKFEELRKSLGKKRIIITNPDIFHLITHRRYQNMTYAHDRLLSDLAEIPDLYVADEFHIFGSHQEAAIINSMLLIRHSRERQRPLKFIFTSATYKPQFKEKLESLGFNIKSVHGNYISEELEDNPPGYRQICQRIQLEFIKLEENTDSLEWLLNQLCVIKEIFKAQKSRFGQGLIILNSVTKVRQVVNQLKPLLEPEILVKEISGIVDSKEREDTVDQLFSAKKPILVVGTSAVDVGVDFDINLLIFEVSDSATFTQRFGRIGRIPKGDQPTFKNCQAFVLIPNWMSWIWKNINNILTEGEKISRNHFMTETVECIFDSPQNFPQYQNYWGALQAQGMLISLSGENLKNKYEREERMAITQRIRDRMKEDLYKLYRQQLEKKRGHWYALSKDETGKQIQNQLLQFRGGSVLQVGCWENDKKSLYTYELLKILSHTELEFISKKDFFEIVKNQNRSEFEFPKNYLQIYLKIKKWLDIPSPHSIEFECDYLTRELRFCTLSTLAGILLKRHPQKQEINQILESLNLLTFLIPISYKKNSHWNILNALHLPATFGIYRISDEQGKDYACAFNQDALLLESLKYKLPRCKNTEPYIF
ncbi:MAG: type I-D CRISPR-associated helicase Cas3' [Microcoleaceae cyanobacterium]